MAVMASAIAIGAGISSLVVGNQLKQQQKGAQARAQRQLEPRSPHVPRRRARPPTTRSPAPRRVTRPRLHGSRAASAGGFASTILTGPQVAAPVQVQRKTLLGQ
jgi:hypothetical protein